MPEKFDLDKILDNSIKNDEVVRELMLKTDAVSDRLWEKYKNDITNTANLCMIVANPAFVKIIDMLYGEGVGVSISSHIITMYRRLKFEKENQSKEEA